MILQVVDLGRMDYAAGLVAQARLVEAVHAGAAGNTLLLLEHPPTLTLGRNARRENVLASDAILARRGVTLHEVNRGGDVTYHGPGQLIGYPIFDLRSFRPRLGVVEFVRRIEEALIRACGALGVPAQRIAGRTGVWTIGGGSIAEMKLAAIGVHISRGITSHGFALNVTADLEDFGLIVPCGIADRGVTNLADEAGDVPGCAQAVTLSSTAVEVVRQMGRVFGADVLWLGSLDELTVAAEGR